MFLHDNIKVNILRNSKQNIPRFPINQQNILLDHNQQVVSLNQQKLQELPKIANFFNLRILNLNDNFIKQIQFEEFDKLKHIIIITIRNNLLQDFQFPSNFNQLKQLDISQNHIRILRPEIGNLTNLDHLYIAHNSFVEIPSQLTKLKYNLYIFQLDWFKYGEMYLLELFEQQELIFALFNMLEQVFINLNTNLLGIKQLLNHQNYKQFALKFRQPDIVIKYKIHQSILDEDIGVLRMLLSESKMLNELNEDGYSPLAVSIQEEKYLAARYLLYANANPNVGAGWFMSCLNIAVSKLQYYLVLDLLKKGAIVNQLDMYKNNCLHYLFSVFHQNESEGKKILQILLKSGIDPNHKNDQGCSPCHLAIQKGYINIIQYIFESGDIDKNKFDLTQKTELEKFTPLHLAVMSRNVTLVKIILNLQPDQLFSKNLYDLTPMDYLKNDLTIFKYLKGFQKGYLNKRIKLMEVQQQSYVGDISEQSHDDLEVKQKYNSTLPLIEYESPLAKKKNEVLSQHFEKVSNEQASKKERKSYMRYNEIARQIPLSPNNLKMVEQKNLLGSTHDVKKVQTNIYKTMKKIAYEFECQCQNQINYLTDDTNNLSEQMADYIAIKLLLFSLNKIKNIIEQDKIYHSQWQFLLKNIKQNVQSESFTVVTDKDTTTQYTSSQKSQLSMIFYNLIKKIEKNYFCKNGFELEYLQNFYLSLHSGFGLSRMVVSINQELKAVFYKITI
ncbi:hypothetical protein pb186bvf_003061 [Paramecium bursaria]